MPKPAQVYSSESLAMEQAAHQRLLGWQQTHYAAGSPVALQLSQAPFLQSGSVYAQTMLPIQGLPATHGSR